NPLNMDACDLIWKNGEFVPWDDAKVHVLTHGLHYGTGVFEGIRAYDTAQGPAIFRHRDHIKRLYQSAELYYMPIPHAKASGQYLNSVLAKIESHKAGYQEAILLDSHGFVCEGSGENIYLVKDGVVLTPPRRAGFSTGSGGARGTR